MLSMLISHEFLQFLSVDRGFVGWQIVLILLDWATLLPYDIILSTYTHLQEAVSLILLIRLNIHINLSFGNILSHFWMGLFLIIECCKFLIINTWV